MTNIHVVYVIWFDSSEVPGWSDRDAFDFRIGETHSVGILIDETENSLVLSHTYDPDTDSVLGHVHIPNWSIKELRTICLIDLKK